VVGRERSEAVRVPRIVAALSTGVLAAGLVIAPSAVAASPTYTVNTLDELSCAFDTQEGDSVFFFAGAGADGSGSGMFVESPDGVLLLQGDGGSAVFGPTFSAVVALLDPSTGEPVGDATVQATLTLGDPQVEEVRERNGNSWTRGTVITIDYAVEVTSVTVPGYTVLPEADDCTASRIAFDLRTTNPSAQIFHDTRFGSAICPLDGLTNGAVLLSGELRAPRFEVVIDDGVDPLKASGELTLRGFSGSATVPLLSRITGEPVADLTIRVTLNRISKRVHESVRDGRVTVLVSSVPYLASITVDTTDGRSGTTDCFAEEVTDKTIIRPGGDG
jgi:hypothetical protein